MSQLSGRQFVLVGEGRGNMLHHRVISLLLCPHTLRATCRVKLGARRAKINNPFELRRSRRQTPQLRITPALSLPAVSDSAWNAGTAHSRAASQAAVARRGEAGSATAAAPPPIDRNGPPLVPTQSVKGLRWVDGGMALSMGRSSRSPTSVRG